MKQTTFTGTSKTGNFTEALRNAIESAKETLTTDYITWEMEGVSGEDGGFVLVQNLYVKIRVLSTNKSE
jgi:flavin-binding protein dodecin